LSEHEATRLFDLNAEIDRFVPDGASGRRSETLVKTKDLRVVLVTMRAGTTLQEHSAPGTTTMQPLSGRFVFTAEGVDREIAPGDLISAAPGVRHVVQAIEDGAFLLTLAWHANASRD
jgi:quercetin dioxygenase-like cupin family protein